MKSTNTEGLVFSLCIGTTEKIHKVSDINSETVRNNQQKVKNSENVGNQWEKDKETGKR